MLISEKARKIVLELEQGAKDASLSMHDLNEIHRAADHYSKQVGARALRAGGINVTSRVSWISSKTGTKNFGTVEKINPKKVIVREDGDHGYRWTIPPSMLSLED